MDQFTRHNLDDVRKQVNQALATVGKTLGITLSIGTFRYSADQFTTKLTGDIGSDTTAHAKKEWDRYCNRFGLKPEHFGQSVVLRDSTYTIVGIKPRSTKYPILADKDGKVYKVPADRFSSLDGYDAPLHNFTRNQLRTMM